MGLGWFYSDSYRSGQEEATHALRWKAKSILLLSRREAIVNFRRSVVVGCSLALLAVVAISIGARRFEFQSPGARANDQQLERQASAAAYAKTLVTRAAAGEGEATEEVLVSFKGGLTIDQALGVIHRAAPNVTILSATFSSMDSAGIEHTVGVLVRPGEDPHEKLTVVGGVMMQAIAEQARDKLACVKNESGSCEPPEARSVPALTAAAALSPGSFRVYGVAVSGRVTELGAIATEGTAVIQGIEPTAGSPLRAPVFNAGSKEN